MKAAVFLAKLGDRIISVIVGLLILVMLLYGGYSLWDTAMLYRGAFTSSDLMKYKPADTEEGGPTLQELQKINPDVRGWLTVDDTHIDYPVVQGKTDMEYVNKDVYGEFSLSGSIFMDSRNSADFSDNYTLIYGHHMANGAMFGDITSFVEQKYFDAHKTGRLYFPDGKSHEILCGSGRVRRADLSARFLGRDEHGLAAQLHPAAGRPVPGYRDHAGGYAHRPVHLRGGRNQWPCDRIRTAGKRIAGES